jgi:ABC-2 type transport system ATP-binding protein
VAGIEVTELGKVYADGTTALAGVSFEVAEGQIFGLLGRNGAGKTTTVRILTTLTRLTSGSARVLGLDVDRQRELVRQEIGLSMQQAALDQLSTGREHLDLIAGLRKIPARVARERTAELLTAFGLNSMADKLVATYTVGMQRRLDTAMALVGRPRLLFLDEPTTGLDPQSRRALWQIVRKFREDGGTVLLTTQYLDEADELCDQIAIMDGGRIAVSDTPAGLKRGLGGKVLVIRPAPPKPIEALDRMLAESAVRREGGALHIDLTGHEDDLPDVLATLRVHGVPGSDLSLADPTLEEVFVRLTGDGAETGGRSAEAAGVAAIGRTIVSHTGGRR